MHWEGGGNDLEEQFTGREEEMTRKNNALGGRRK